MKKILNYIIVIAVVSYCLLALGCDDDKKGLIESVGIKEAVYNSTDKKMIISLKDDATLQLTPLIYPTDAANKNIRYEHKYPDLMEVSSTGLITGKRFGTDTLTVYTTDGSNIAVNYRIIIIDHMVKATSVSVTAAGRNMNIEAGKTFNLGATVSLLPADVWDKRVTYKSKDESIATVDAQGLVTAIGAIGQTTAITVTAADGSGVYTDCNVTVVNKVWKYTELDRKDWSIIQTSWPFSPNTIEPGAGGGPTGNPEHMIDGIFKPDGGVVSDKDTYFAILKPGKLGTPNDVCFFILDMKKEQNVNYYRFRYRTSTASTNLRVKEGSLYGSNDGTTFTLISKSTAYDESIAENRVIVEENPGAYRYIKFTYDKWNDGGNQMQIAEFYLGYRE